MTSADQNRTYNIRFSAQARKDLKKLNASPLAKNAKKIFELIMASPFKAPPFLEKLKSRALYSRRINQQHRIVYQVDHATKTVEILSCWTHYHE